MIWIGSYPSVLLDTQSGFIEPGQFALLPDGKTLSLINLDGSPPKIKVNYLRDRYVHVYDSGERECTKEEYEALALPDAKSPPFDVNTVLVPSKPNPGAVIIDVKINGNNLR